MCADEGWDLLEKYYSGDESAADKIDKKYSKYVFTIANSFVKNIHDAEDITQEVFAEIFSGSFHKKNNAKFRTFLFYKSKYKALSIIRNKQQKKVII